MKVIVTYRNFWGMDRQELFPEVFMVREDETATEALQRIWADGLNGAIADEEYANDPVDSQNCWCEDNHALITWADGDTKEFYIVEVASGR